MVPWAHSSHSSQTASRSVLPFLLNSQMWHIWAFSYAGPLTWNALPDNIRFVADPSKFQTLLKSHYFTAAFNICWLLLISSCSFFWFFSFSDSVMHICLFLCNRDTINSRDNDDNVSNRHTHRQTDIQTTLLHLQQQPASYVVSCNRMFASSHEWRRLVNAYGVKAWCSWLERWCVC